MNINWDKILDGVLVIIFVLLFVIFSMVMLQVQDLQRWKDSIQIEGMAYREGELTTADFRKVRIINFLSVSKEYYPDN